MRTWPRIRGAIGTGLTWAAAWAAVGMTPRWLFGFNADVPFPLVFGVLGFIAGVIFSGLVVLAERRRRFDQISLPRFAAWGGAGGLLLSAVFVRAASLGWDDALVLAPTLIVACGVSAAGSLALARRAETRALPESGAGTAEAELPGHEKRSRLGGGD